MKLKDLVNRSGLSFSRFLVETTLSGELSTPLTIKQRDQCLFHLRRASSDVRDVRRLLELEFGHKLNNYTELTRALTALELAAEKVQKTWVEESSK